MLYFISALFVGSANMEAIAFDLVPRQAIPVDHIFFVESGAPQLVNCMAWRGGQIKGNGLHIAEARAKCINNRGGTSKIPRKIISRRY